MEPSKNHKIATIVGGALFILGMILCAYRMSQIISHKIVGAKITSVDEFKGECRRVSGKYGECIQANLGVEFPINKAGELKTGKITVEHAASFSVGAPIKVMFLDGKPDTVKLADFSSGWKGPLGVFFLGALVLIVSKTSVRK